MTKGKIMIVEDEAIIREEMKDIVENLGYEVSGSFNNAEKAIESLMDGTPNLILMDIKLKGEMDGIEAAKIIRDQYDIPVVFSTAYLDEERIERAKITMPFGYVLKPIQERDLKVTLEMALYVAKVDEERKRAELELIESEEKFRALYTASPDAVLLADRKTGLILDANKAAADLFETNLENIIGRHQWELHPEQQKKKAEESFKFQPHRQDDYAPPVEIEIITANNQKRIVEITGKIIDVNNMECVLGNFRDITERKKVEKALLDRERKFSAIFNESFQFALILDTNGTVLEMNKLCYEVCDDLAEGSMGIPFEDALWWKDYEDVRQKTRDAIKKANDGIATSDEVIFIDKDRNPHDGMRIFSPISDENNEIAYIAVVGLYITNHKHRTKIVTPKIE